VSVWRLNTSGENRKIRRVHRLPSSPFRLFRVHSRLVRRHGGNNVRHRSFKAHIGLLGVDATAGIVDFDVGGLGRAREIALADLKVVFNLYWFGQLVRRS
jgi:hypothetical protein